MKWSIIGISWRLYKGDKGIWSKGVCMKGLYNDIRTNEIILYLYI